MGRGGVDFTQLRGAWNIAHARAVHAHIRYIPHAYGHASVYVHATRWPWLWPYDPPPPLPNRRRNRARSTERRDATREVVGVGEGERGSQ